MRIPNLILFFPSNDSRDHKSPIYLFSVMFAANLYLTIFVWSSDILNFVLWMLSFLFNYKMDHSVGTSYVDMYDYYVLQMYALINQSSLLYTQVFPSSFLPCNTYTICTGWFNNIYLSYFWNVTPYWNIVFLLNYRSHETIVSFLCNEGEDFIFVMRSINW